MSDRGAPCQHFLNTFLVRHQSQTQGIPDETLIAYAQAQATIDQAAAFGRIADTLEHLTNIVNERPR